MPFFQMDLQQHGIQEDAKCENEFNLRLLLLGDEGDYDDTANTIST